MIAFGCSIIQPHLYEHHARPGLERAAEADSPILAHAAAGSIARSFNLMLETAAKLDGLEALVLVHEDAEILDPATCSKLRNVFADPDVAIAGCVGARGVRDIAWWEGAVTWSSAPYRYGELGGGSLLWPPQREGTWGPGEVDTIYGVMMALSPWAVRTLRFDESIGMLHGYDFDLCRQARAAGRKVLATDIELAHHHSLDLVSQIEIWVAAHMRAAELWDAADPGPDAPDEQWRERARRAEADAAAARLLAASKLLQADASAQLYTKQVEEVLGSRSWRLTEPLRRANAFVKTGRARLARG